MVSPNGDGSGAPPAARARSITALSRSGVLGLVGAGALGGLAVGLAVGGAGLTPGATAAAALAVIALACVAATSSAPRASGLLLDPLTTPPPADADARPVRGTLRDRLTGLYTSTLLEDALERDVRRARRARRAVSVVLAEVDHFDALATELGPVVAQDVLQQAARFLEESVRASDVAARHGSGGFALLLADADGSQALVRMEELRVRLRDHALATLEGVPVPLTMSFGVASFPEHGESAGELLAAAQQALDSARRLGHNRVVAARVVSR